MRLVVKTSTVALVISTLTVSLIGCGAGIAISSIKADRGDAFKIAFQRPTGEAINNFRVFLEDQGMKVTSINGDAIKTAPGNLGTRSASRRVGTREVRIKAVANSTNGGTSLVVISEYLDPTSNEWVRVTSDVGVLHTTGDEQSTERSIFKEVKRMLVSGYSEKNVEAVTAEQISFASTSPGSTNQRDTTSVAETTQSKRPQPEERPGDGGDDVEWVQKTLNDLGHDCGPEDGVMGPNTRSCIRSFQNANNLEVTGKVNEATYQKMLEER